MNVKNLRTVDMKDLKSKLAILYKERLVLRFEKTSGVEFKKNHKFKIIKKKIAQILTIITELNKKI